MCDCCLLLNLTIILVINNSLNLISPLILIILLNWEHAGSKGLLLFIIFIILNIIIEILLFFIILWVKKKLLLKYDTKVINFGFMGLIISIIGIIIVFIAELLIKMNFDDIDYPYKNYKSATFSFFRNLDSLEKLQEKEHFCETLDIDYYTKTITKKEIVVLFLNSSIVELISLINTCLWTFYLKLIKKALKLIKIHSSTITVRKISNRKLKYIYSEVEGNQEIEGGLNQLNQNMNLQKNNNNVNKVNTSIPKNQKPILSPKKTFYNISKNDTDFKDSIIQRDKSECSLNVKQPIIINTLNIFNKKIYI